MNNARVSLLNMHTPLIRVKSLSLSLSKNKTRSLGILMDSKGERTKKRFATRLIGLTAAKKFAGRIEEFFLPLSPRRFLKVSPTSRNPPPFHFWTNDGNERSGSRVNFRNLSWFIAVWNIGWQGRERERRCQFARSWHSLLSIGGIARLGSWLFLETFSLPFSLQMFEQRVV